MSKSGDVLTKILCIGLGCVAASLGWPATNEVQTGAAPPVVPILHAPAGVPNVVVVLLDDVGFGAASTFGGPVMTPTMGSLANEGLRYNRFHTTAVCSPTRASLLTGRNPHAVGVGAVLNAPSSYPGYRGVLQKDSATIAELLREHGYSTAAFGKWHLTPDWEASPVGPFDRWPTGQGFEKYYGFIGAETDQFNPTLYDGTTPVLRSADKNYSLTEDLVTRAINWMHVQHSVAPDKPFFMYFAPGGTHAPLQAPKAWIDKFRGQFDGGWDEMRGETLARQETLGVVPKNTKLTPRPDELPAWNSLSADQKKVDARLMEVYAAYLAYTDAQIGRLVQSLKESGQFDNTLFIYVMGDNGGSLEGGLYGRESYMGNLQGMPDTPAASLVKRLDSLGGPTSYAQYPAGWAWAMSSPLPWAKTMASHLGGTRNGMVLSWPARLKDHGGLRSQFSHVNDLAPTILEAAGLKAPAEVNGVKQRPMDGTSLIYTFADKNAPERHNTQYFEVFGNRAIYHDGWMASAWHKDRLPWQAGCHQPPKRLADDTWALYNLNDDFSQSTDLAAKEPEKLKEMQALFLSEASKNQVLPLQDTGCIRTPLPSLPGNRTEFSYFTGAVGIPEADAPPIKNRSYSIVATVNIPKGGAHGVIATMGGTAAGWSLYMNDSGKPVYVQKVFDVARMVITGQKPLAPGKNVVQFDFDYEGPGYAKGGTGTLKVNGATVGTGHLPVTTPGTYSADETFDVGTDTGSPAGDYPFGYPFSGAIERVDIRLR
ncbi:arylsulfatase [Burkholderia pyrrocinia]|uniref:arylsulfatase n=1 Tax=Burkholderia pyrrocinia TaxID=60550 RepID=UPI0015774E31|nr:arylsulfatase [Burkholderia pyrrocinia]NTX28536.1 arylsulfatase [Burkholderia pyrrocinia]